jgi:hypothetical protein
MPVGRVTGFAKRDLDQQSPQRISPGQIEVAALLA